MLKKLPTVLTIFAVLVLFVAMAFASDSSKVEAEQEQAEEVTHDFIGAKKCKICHKEQFTSWETTKHAHAWESLKPEEQKKEECAGCHSTGTTKKGKLLEGVQCEACHGAGADYKKKSIMQDLELAKKNGLVTPDSTLCVSCHNEASPTFKSFEYCKYRASEKGIHKMKAKEGKKEKPAGKSEG